MTSVTLVLATTGVGYTASLLMRLIIWLDGAGDANA